jgi:hypothetical protein
MREKYQVMPALPDDEYQALKADIAARGVQVAIETDEYGNTLDGHHRQRACRELGINDYPTVVRSGLSEAEKLTHARKANLLRRHLTQEQRRALLADELRGDPQRSNRQIGAALGIDHKTVGAARERLGSTGEIPQLDKTTGGDGKARPVKSRSRRKRPLGSKSPWDGADPDDDGGDNDEFDGSEKSEKQKRRDDREWEEALGLRSGELAVKRAKIDHAIGLIEANVDPSSEKVTKLLMEGSAVVMNNTGYNPFHGRSEREVRDWHLFVLFLVREMGWRVDGAAQHVENLLQRPFQNVGEWLGEEGDKTRMAWCYPAMPPQIVEQWRAFAVGHEGETATEIEAMLVQHAA